MEFLWREAAVFLITFVYYAAIVIVVLLVTAADFLTLPLLLLAEDKTKMCLWYLVQVGLNALFVYLYWPLEYVFTIAGLVLPMLNLAEIYVDEVRTSRHRFDKAPSLGETSSPNWKLVAALRSSSNMYGSQQFFPAISCNRDRRLDPFSPVHASLIYVIEVRRRCNVWQQIVLWRVSLLHGGQKKLHEFNTVSMWLDGGRDDLFNPRYKNSVIRCFQSGDYILIRQNNSERFHDYKRRQFLRIYDLRFGFNATVQGFDIFTPDSLCIRLSCIRRLAEPVDWSFNGWMIRSLEASFERENIDIRVRLANTVYELTIPNDLRVVSSEEIVFGQFYRLPRAWTPVRTSQNAFGVYVESSRPRFEDSPTMLFDEATSEYVYFDRLGDMKFSDPPLAAYWNTAMPEGYEGCVEPAFLNNRECIEVGNDGSVFRSQLARPTLQYDRVKSAFQKDPDLRYSMNAEKFEKRFHIGGMEPHLG